MKKPIGYEGERYGCYFWFVGWWCFSLGFHISLAKPFNIEIHVPFGFIRIGQLEELYEAEQNGETA